MSWLRNGIGILFLSALVAAKPSPRRAQVLELEAELRALKAKLAALDTEVEQRSWQIRKEVLGGAGIGAVVGIGLGVMGTLEVQKKNQQMWGCKRGLGSFVEDWLIRPAGSGIFVGMVFMGGGIFFAPGSDPEFDVYVLKERLNIEREIEALEDRIRAVLDERGP